MEENQSNNDLVVDPYKPSKRKVALVGMARTSRHLAPWDDDDFEIWGINEAYAAKNLAPDGTPYMKRWDRWFQLHPYWDFTRKHNFNDPGHWDWLRNADNRRRTDFPIYMLEEFPEVPGSVRYPLTEILAEFGPNVRYFTSTFAYMMALAIWMGFEEIHLYGFEMSSEEEYRHQKACAEFWIGIAIGRGIKVVLPDGCRLLGQMTQLYGYEKVPGVTKMHMEIRRNEAHRRAQKAQAELNAIVGAKQQLIRRFKVTQGKSKKSEARMNAEMSQLIQEEINKRIELQSYLSQAHAYETIIRDMDALPDPNEVSLVLPKDQIQVTAMEVSNE